MIRLSEKNGKILFFILFFVLIVLFWRMICQNWNVVYAFVITLSLIIIVVVYYFVRNKLEKSILFKEITDKAYPKYFYVYDLYQKEVLSKKKRYDVFVKDCCNSDELKDVNPINNRVKDLILDRKDIVDKYFDNLKFDYKDYLNLENEYNLIEKMESEDGKGNINKPQNTITLRKKVLILDSLFRICNVADISLTNKATFMRNLLEVEPNTKRISDTNVYKYLKKNQNAPNEPKEILSLIKDKKYVVEQLSLLGLEDECRLINNDIESLKDSIIE